MQFNTDNMAVLCYQGGAGVFIQIPLPSKSTNSNDNTDVRLTLPLSQNSAICPIHFCF